MANPPRTTPSPSATPSWTRQSLQDDLVMERDEEEGRPAADNDDNIGVEGDGFRSVAHPQQTSDQASTSQADAAGSQYEGDANDSASSSAMRKIRFSSAEATPTSSPSPTSPRVPAAGLGTRITPRPVPKSSSSLRHISSKARTVSFGTPLPEDRDPSQINDGPAQGQSSVQKSVEAAQRREKEQRQPEAVMDSDVSDDDDDEFLVGTGGETNGLTTSSDSAGHERSHRARRDPAFAKLSLSSSEDEDDFALPPPHVRITSHEDSTKDAKGVRASTKRGKGILDVPPSYQGTSSGLQTPGPRFPRQLHTPVGTPPDLDFEPAITAQERLEWHTMLQSTLRSEVLKSETKRITSADAPKFTREQLMYRRWLDIRACLRGQGHEKGALDEEERRANEDCPNLVKDVIEAIKACRNGSAESDLADDESQQDATDAVIDEVGSLLKKVDRAEAQFPSLRKMAESVPEWMDAGVQNKLASLYSWYNVILSIRLQIQILQEWTGSKTLDVQSRGKEQNASQTGPDDHHGFRAELEEGTFLERMLKENSLQDTFEKRTLRTLGQLVTKAKDAIAQHHQAFVEMALPSFEDELVQLISFPTRLMEAALRVRLDYVGKLTDPSYLIVDSLIDDLRAAVALACRIKVQYHAIIAPQPAAGWDLPPCIGSGYDLVLREALQYFFRLLNYKLKGSLFFKETEILEPEWHFLSTAVEVIDGADILVACSITRIVNKLFLRIVRYFERELAAPSTRRSAMPHEQDRLGQVLPPQMSGSAPGQSRGPSVAGGLTKGQVKMTLEEKARWIHQVFDSVRIRSRKLLYFSREIRSKLENSAEYDLSTLRTPANDQVYGLSPTAEEVKQAATESEGDVNSDAAAPATAVATDTSSMPMASRTRLGANMSLTQFLQTLIDAGYFLVLTGTFEVDGIYLIAEPSLHDKPEMVQELFTKCMRRAQNQQGEEGNAVPTATKKGDPTAPLGGVRGVTTAEESGKDEDSDTGGGGMATDSGAYRAKTARAQRSAPADEEDSNPKYLLILTPRDAFMWTGKVMYLAMSRLDISLKDRRLRLIADGPQRRLELCKKHLYNVFGADYAAVSAHLEDEDNAEDGRLRRQRRRSSVVQNGEAFPLDIVDESLAHMSVVQSELRRINKGVYLLSDTVIRAVPKLRRKMRNRRGERSAAHPNRPESHSATSSPWFGKGGDCDELIQNCFGMAAEQGFRAVPFIESNRLRGQMTFVLARLAIDWVAFICDDCEPSDRRTFKWAVAALENAMYVTRSEDILHISDDDFIHMRRKVASCVGLLVSHFDILGARDSAAKAKEEEERLERERERAERIRASAENDTRRSSVSEGAQGQATRAIMPLLDHLDSGMRETEQRWMQKVLEWEEARQSIESEQRLIGRVLDDTRLEDRGLQFLASSTSRIQIRWQQGRFIGGGTFGTVYLAVNLDSGGLMAVKEIRFQDISSTPSMYKQIKDEMNVMEMLSHPNIVEYYGIEVHRDKVYIFEEYCQGGSLAQLLEHGRIEDEMVMQVYTLQMLDGLVYLHSKGVVHRDIKPDNILLDHMGVIKFVDFGAAKVLAKNSRTIQRSRKAGVVVGSQAMGGMLGPDGKPAATSLQGTPMYMSPEVIKGENRGRRGAMDVWSLGCVVLEFATGHRPWSQLDNEWAIMFHIGMAQQHPPLPEPGQLSDLGIDFIRQCLVIDPYERPSATEMREHAWIKNLVEALNAANEEEAAMAAAASSSSAGLESAMGAEGAPGRSNSTSTYGGGDGSSTSSSLSSVFVHGNESAAGVAAMVATPGTRSINGFSFGRPSAPSLSSAASSSFSRLSLEHGKRNSSSQHTPFSTTTTPSTTGAGPIAGNQVSEKDALAGDDQPPPEHARIHDPGHPDHSHPGYDALVADLAYRREEEEKQTMMTPYAESLSAIDDVKDV